MSDAKAVRDLLAEGLWLWTYEPDALYSNRWVAWVTRARTILEAPDDDE